MKRPANEIFWQSFRFALVGAINTAIDFAIFNILAAYVIGLQTLWAYLACRSVAFVAAMTNSFFMNSRFTFRDAERAQKAGVWGRFALVTISTFAVSTAIATLVFHFLVHYMLLPVILAGNVSVAASVLIGMVINFLGYKFLVFKDREKMDS